MATSPRWAGLPKSCEYDGAIRLSSSPSVSEIEAKEVFAAFALQISDRQGQKRNFLAAKAKSLKTTTSTAVFSTQGQTYNNFYAGIFDNFQAVHSAPSWDSLFISMSG